MAPRSLGLVYADTFLDRVHALPNETKKLVMRKVAEFCAAPDAPGFNAEALSGKAKQNGWHSARVDRDIRIIYALAGTTAHFHWVDRHKPAYEWAERNRFRVHPTTGSPQRYPLPDAHPPTARAATEGDLFGQAESLNFVRDLDDAALRKAAEQDSGLADKAQLIMAERGERPAQLTPAATAPFAAEEDDYLLGLGVPEEWVPHIKALPSAHALDELIGVLPDEAWERLVDLAGGKRPAVSLQRQIALLADPFHHPDARRRFLMIRSDAELERALSDTWERWQVFLHPSQRAAVEANHRGPSLISGAAGTGKSVVAVHRAAWLARHATAPRILMTSFSKTLAARLSLQLDRLLAGESHIRSRVEVVHLDKLLMDLARTRLGGVNLVNRSHLQPMLERAAKAHAVREFDGAFLWAEWDGVVDYWGIGSEEAYRRTSREGRGTALSPQARSKLWPVFADVRAEMARQRVHTWSSLAYALGSHLDNRGERPFTHVVADEAQDFGPCQLRFIRALAGEGRNDLTFAGDLGQQIYRRPFSWISIGIDIRGRSSRLRISYRTTDQIRTLADGVAAAAGEKNAEEARDALSVRAGPAPRLVEALSGAEEAGIVGRWMAACIKDGVRPEQIAIFARTTKTLERVAAKAAKIAGVPFVELKDVDGPTAGAVSLGTMHRAKGLEYRAVAVIGCSAGMVPLAKALEEAPDETERDLVMKQERHLLYVALTRARDYLLVTWSGRRSPFLKAAGEALLAS